MKRILKPVLILAMSLYALKVFAQKEIRDTISGGPFLMEMQSSFTKAYCDPEIYREGIRVFKELVEINPNDKDWNYYLGMCYYNLDKYEEAEKYLQVASTDFTYKIKILYLKEIHDQRSVRL